MKFINFNYISISVICFIKKKNITFMNTNDSKNIKKVFQKLYRKFKKKKKKCLTL
jgi:hypothetical protein